VVDGNLVTSRWPMDLPAFMREIMNKVDELLEFRLKTIEGDP
jgi:putative intracellular protease/amidase